MIFRPLISGFSRFQHADAFIDEWQPDRQGKASALAALDGELTAVLTHDAAYNQQSKPTAGWFGCEIRLKYTTQVFRRHTAAGIDKSDNHMCIGQIGPNAQRAVAVHGFDTVLDHVVKRLLHLIAIELKQWQIRAQLLFNDYLAVLKLRREKANRFFDSWVYIFRPQLRTWRPDGFQALRNGGVAAA